MNTKQVKDFIRMPYAWPGGYPLFAITADGGCLCKDCVKENAKIIIAATRQDHIYTERDWAVVAIETNWEDETLTCDHCGKSIESAYGEE